MEKQILDQERMAKIVAWLKTDEAKVTQEKIDIETQEIIKLIEETNMSPFDPKLKIPYF
jgi:phage-related baseplate assembly protein